MTHQEQRLYLLRELLAEAPRRIPIPVDEQGQKDLLRALMNVRAPKPIGQDFLNIQDEYLSAERNLRGVVDGCSLPSIPSNPHIVLWQGDITTLKVDAIVNAANSKLRGCFYPCHSCIDNIVHSRSGIQLRLLCDDIMNRQGYDEPTGKAKITPAFNLPSRYILHTVGPIVSGRATQQDRALLASCYRAYLTLAVQKGCKSIAFCCISTGEFHFPNEEAAGIAIAAVENFLRNGNEPIRVIFDVFKDVDLRIYQKLLGVS